MLAGIALDSVYQKTDSHCGPAVLQMLLAHRGIHRTQDQIVELARVRTRIAKHGTRPDQLAMAVSKATKRYRLYFKQNTTLEDLEKLIQTYNVPVGVNWQGLFYDTLEEEAKDFPDENIDGDHGHYSVVININRNRNKITIADTYSEYYKKPRKFECSWFESRWWDKDIEVNKKTGKKSILSTNRFCFVLAKNKDTFPQELGMQPADKISELTVIQPRLRQWWQWWQR